MAHIPFSHFSHILKMGARNGKAANEEEERSLKLSPLPKQIYTIMKRSQYPQIAANESGKLFLAKSSARKIPHLGGMPGLGLAWTCRGCSVPSVVATLPEQNIILTELSLYTQVFSHLLKLYRMNHLHSCYRIKTSLHSKLLQRHTHTLLQKMISRVH